MINVRICALLFGIVFLLVGALGVVPGVTAPHSQPGVTITSGLGLLLGSFPVNVLHNTVRVPFGIWSLPARDSVDAARTTSGCTRCWRW